MSKEKKVGRPAEVDSEKILKVARTLFAEFGYSGASIRLIAERAGCNVAMISYYFGNKEGLRDKMIEEYFRSAREVFSKNEVISEEFAEFKDPEIRQFANALYEFAVFAHTHREIHQILIRDAMEGGKLLLNALTKNDYGVVPLIHKRLRHFMAEKKLPKDLDVNMVGLSIIGPITSCSISNQVVAKIHGFSKVDAEFFHRLIVHHMRQLFQSYKNL